MRTPARKIECETQCVTVYRLLSTQNSQGDLLLLITSFTDWHKLMQALDAGPKQIDEASVRVEQENVNKASSDQMFSKS
jgi:hypothetical protein